MYSQDHIISGGISFWNNKNANFDVVCMQDMRRLSSDAITNLRYNLLLTNLKKKIQPRIGIAIYKPLDFVRDNILHMAERLERYFILNCRNHIRLCLLSEKILSEKKRTTNLTKTLGILMQSLVFLNVIVLLVGRRHHDLK